MGVRVLHLPARRPTHHTGIASLLRALGATALAAALVACEDGPSGPGNRGAAVARVIIVPDSVALPRTQTMRLEARLVDAAGNELDGRTTHWTSSDTTRVKVASGGTITATDVGWSLVKASSEGKVDSVKVVVTAN